MVILNNSEYQDMLGIKLAEDIEPDPEDFYMAEIEGKANDYDKMKVIIQNTIDYINFLSIGPDGIKEMQEKSINGFVRFSQTTWGEELLDLLNEYKDVDKDD